MNKVVSRCVFVVSVGVWVILSCAAPWVLGDNNGFLADFVNHELLNFLGVIVAITLASTANLHLEFNKIEDSAGRAFLYNTRRAVRNSAYSLLFLLGLAVVVVIAKPFAVGSQVATSFANGLALLIVLFNILVLVDITRLVFRIEPMHKLFPEDDEETNP